MNVEAGEVQVGELLTLKFLMRTPLLLTIIYLVMCLTRKMQNNYITILIKMKKKNKRKRINRPRVRVGTSCMIESRLAAAARMGCIEAQCALLRSMSI
jgi:hypothetical protein